MFRPPAGPGWTLVWTSFRNGTAPLSAAPLRVCFVWGHAIGCPSVSGEAQLTPIIVCGGSACRGRREKEWERLMDRLGAAGLCVERSKCLDVCEGPVAIVTIDGQEEVVANLRWAKKQRSLIDAVRRQKRSKLPTVVSGKKRKRAITRAMKVLANR